MDNFAKLLIIVIFCLSSVGCQKYNNGPREVDGKIQFNKGNSRMFISNNTFRDFAPASKNDSSQQWIGYVGASVSILLFGSNFVPVKKFDTGDGMFFQWVLCSAIWISGLIANCAVGSPTFYPFAMVGGCLWATGNICVVPIIKTIGLGLGMLIWGAFNMLSGWATGRFGLFNTEKDPINDLTMNTVSIVLAMLSAVCWLFVKSDAQAISREPDVDDDAELLVAEQDLESLEEADSSWVDALTVVQRRVYGSVLSIFSGLLYGFSFVPVLYIKHNYGDSDQDIDYAFAHFCGIYVMSTLYFVIYCCSMKNRPKLYPSAILPGIVSGGMWGIAQLGWFIANRYLTPAISFPIVTSGPALVASIWGVAVFKEVRGRRNFMIMAVAYSLTIAAGALAGVSKLK